MPSTAVLAALVRELNDRLAYSRERHELAPHLYPACSFHLVDAGDAGDVGELVELHLRYGPDPSPRPFTPRLPAPVLLALVSGMHLALDIEYRGLARPTLPSDRLQGSLELPATPPAERSLPARPRDSAGGRRAPGAS